MALINKRLEERVETLPPISHYCGQSGIEYFAYQSRFGDVTGELIARKLTRHIRPSDVVLDFGCGGGFVLRSLVCRQRLGVEINPAARAVATKAGVACFETLDQIPDDSIDVAISHHSLEHVSSPLLVLQHLELKLKPGGLLLLVVPIDDWRAQRKYNRSDINHHLFTWTPLLLGHLLYEAGFDMATLSTAIGVNGWLPGFKHFYGVIPMMSFDLLSNAWRRLRKHREIYAVIRKREVHQRRSF